MIKKLALFFPLLLCTLCATYAVGACSNTSYANGWTCVQQKGSANGGSATSQTTTMGANTVSGHGVLVMGEFCASGTCTSGTVVGTTVSITDGASDSWTGTASPTSPIAVPGVSGVANNIAVFAFFLPNVGVTNSFVCHTSIAVSFLACYVTEWTGHATSTPFDKDGGVGTFADVTSATISTSANTTNATDLIAGFIALNTSATLTPGTGFTDIGQDFAGEDHEAKSVTSTGAQAATWTWTGAARYQAIVVAIKAAGGATAAVAPAVVE